MVIVIDGKEVRISDDGGNVVDAAAKAGIGIPAPCYRAAERNVCCKACVVEINGEQAFACCTEPSEGMRIIVNRADLKELRKRRIAAYKAGESEPCGCGSGGCDGAGDTGRTGSSCGCGSNNGESSSDCC